VQIRTVFLPDMQPPDSASHMPPSPGEPWRLLFLGRILPYKGLSLFVDLIEELIRRGIAVEAGVFGEGSLGSCGPRLLALGAEIVNRWLSDAEIDRVLARYHAVVLSHVEASQSGVAAVAFGAGVPVIATPVGGLVEQIEDGTSGVLATRVDASSLADAASRLLLDPALYRRIYHHLIASREQRSVRRFVDQCVFYALER
jgi:glycosyltransferase involved in cell wall biosynthesis